MKKRIGNALTILGLVAGLIGFGGFFLPFFNKAPQRHDGTAGYYRDTEGNARGWRIAERFVWGLGIGATLILLGGYLCDSEQRKTHLANPRHSQDSPQNRRRRGMLSASIVALTVLWTLILYLLVLALIGLSRASGEIGTLDFKFTVVLALAAVLILVIIPIQVVRYVRERRALL